MPEASDEFALLLQRARGGDARALEELAQKYEPEVRIVARVLLGPALRPYLGGVERLEAPAAG